MTPARDRPDATGISKSLPGEHACMPGSAAGLQREPDPQFALANERTFLAWCRTALALVAAGLAVSQLATRSAATIKVISSLGLIGFGAVIAVVGYRHWRRNDTALRLGQPLSRSLLPRFLTHGIGWFAVAAAALAVVRLTS